MEFRYRAQNNEGAAVTGIVDAQNQDAAVAVLHERGFTVLSLEEVKRGIFEGGDINQILNRPNTKDVVIFTRQLSTLIEADVPLAEGMRTMAQQTDKPGFARIIADVSERLEGGTSLSDAFAAHPKLFSQFYIKLIRSGEVSGRLQQTLQYLADYLERNQAILSKVRNALAYPAFIVVAMVAVALIMAVYVLPQLLIIFEESGSVELPITTRILIATTEFINQYIFLVLGFIVLVVVGVQQWLKSEEGSAQWDGIKIKLPIFGTILKSLYLSRLAENLATLVKSDIAILDALRVTADVVDNAVYREILLHAEEEVRGGGSISDVFRRYPDDVPSLLSSMIAIGERTGKMDQMLGHVSTFYRTESENRINAISSLVEPVIVVVLGIGVAVLVSSILLPLYSLVDIS